MNAQAVLQILQLRMETHLLKRQRSPQEHAQHVLRSKRLKLALESDLTDENIAEAMKEAPV